MGSLATRLLAPALFLLVGVSLGACGASPPREADIFHDPALRPGVVEANEAERELLAQLGEARGAAPVVVGARSYVLEALYDAASGRRCRVVVVGTERRLACENPDASWVFVPDLVRGEAP